VKRYGLTFRENKNQYQTALEEFDKLDVDLDELVEGENTHQSSQKISSGNKRGGK